MSGINRNHPVVIEINDSSDENENDGEYALLKRLSLTKNRTPSRDYSSSNSTATSETGEITGSSSSNTTGQNEELPKTTSNRRRSLENIAISANEGEPLAKKIQIRRKTLHPSASRAEKLVPGIIQNRNSVHQSSIPTSNEDTRAGKIQNRRKSVYPSTSSSKKDESVADKIQSSSKEKLSTETISNSHNFPLKNVEPIPQKIQNRRKSLYPSTSKADNNEPLPAKIQNRRYSVHPSLIQGVPAKIHNRRKSVHHAIRSTEGLTFESENDEETTTKTEKKHPKEDLNPASDDDIVDEEMKHLLKKIAYCRVFANYLLGQYNMLTIDFKLFSNLEQLKLELKKRVDTYTAIKRSRQELIGGDK